MSDLKRLRASVDQSANDIRDWLACNSANNIEDYRFEAGRYSALRLVLAWIEELQSGRDDDEGVE